MFAVLNALQEEHDKYGDTPRAGSVFPPPTLETPPAHWEQQAKKAMWHTQLYSSSGTAN